MASLKPNHLPRIAREGFNFIEQAGEPIVALLPSPDMPCILALLILSRYSKLLVQQHRWAFFFFFSFWSIH
jgi:hypothetical protein